MDPGNHVTPSPGLDPLKVRMSPSLVAVTPMSFAQEIVEGEGSLLARSLKLLSCGPGPRSISAKKVGISVTGTCYESSTFLDTSGLVK